MKQYKKIMLVVFVVLSLVSAGLFLELQHRKNEVLHKQVFDLEIVKTDAQKFFVIVEKKSMELQADNAKQRAVNTKLLTDNVALQERMSRMQQSMWCMRQICREECDNRYGISSPCIGVAARKLQEKFNFDPTRATKQEIFTMMCIFRATCDSLRNQCEKKCKDNDIIAPASPLDPANPMNPGRNNYTALAHIISNVRWVD